MIYIDILFYDIRYTYILLLDLLYAFGRLLINIMIIIIVKIWYIHIN